MKQTLSLILLLALALPGIGQQKQFDQAKILKEHRSFMRAVQRLNQQQTAAKTTSVGERPIAASRYVKDLGQFKLMDTFKYRYSANRGAAFDYELLDFNMFYSPALETGFAVNEPLDIMSDTLIWWQRNMNNNQIQIAEKIIASYTPDNRVLDFDEYISWTGPLSDGVGYTHFYNGAGNVTDMAVRSYMNGQWDSSGRKHFFYDAQNRLIADSITQYQNGVWAPSSKRLYRYDANGNLSHINSFFYYMNVWYNDLQDTLMYYPNNKLQLVIRKMNMDTAWVNYLKDTFAYAPGSDHSILWESYINNPFANTGWEGMNRQVKHLNAQGLPDTVVVSQIDMSTGAWVPYLQKAAVYNSFGNPVFVNTYHIDSLQNVHYNSPDSMYYFYEQYNLEPTSVATPGETAGQFTLYPNPAADRLQLKGKAAAGTRMHFSIINNAGQLVVAEQGVWNQHYSLSLAGLASGTYHLVVRAPSGAVMYRSSFLKQ